MSLMLSGTGVSRGIAIAPVRKLHEIQPQAQNRDISANQVPDQLLRLRQAVSHAVEELHRLREQMRGHLPGEIGAVLDSHVLMLDDPAFAESVETLVREQQISAEWALASHRDQVVRAFDVIDDAYLRARRDDVDQVINRVLRALARRREKPQPRSASAAFVLVTSNIAPADLLMHRSHGLMAVISEHGGVLSHATIVARSVGVPAVTGVAAATALLEEGELVAVDGTTGMIVAGPDDVSLAQCKSAQRSERRARRALTDLRDAEAVTLDGEHVSLQTNVEISSDVSLSRRMQADGIGLYRTESLYLNREDLPGEDEQFRTYRSLLKRMRGRTVTVRTMDVWSSSRMPSLADKVPKAAQPALGLRAMRLCLRHPELFRPQIRALLRASAYGPLRILLPMIGTAGELDQAQALIEGCKKELAGEKRAFDADIPVGLMVEVPAAAVMARAFVPRVAFLSIGTNDLIQYTLAIDRSDEAVQGLYDPLNPAVLRLVSMTLRAARRTGLPVSLCGEMAGDPRYTRVLLGLGLRELSMHPASLLEVKRVVRECDTRRISAASKRLLNSNSTEQSARLLQKINQS